MKKKYGVFFIILLTSFVFAHQTSASEAGFSVRAILPDNQVTREHSYFDLLMAPGMKQTLQVELSNDTDSEVIVDVQANTAFTNENGIVEYTQVPEKTDKSLKIPFSKIAKVEPKVVLPAKDKKIIDIDIQMPEESFDGVILGGLYFSEHEDKDEKNEKTGSVQVENLFSFTIGVLLTETDIVVEPDLVLNSAGAGQILGRNVILANLQNKEAALLKNLRIHAKVYKGDDLYYEQLTDDMKMAPNSNFDYAVDLNKEFFEPGDYRIEIEAISNGRTWHFNKDFKIDKKEADSFNEQTAYPDSRPKMNITPYLIGGAIILILFVGIAFWIGKRSSKKK